MHEIAQNRVCNVQKIISGCAAAALPRPRWESLRRSPNPLVSWGGDKPPPKTSLRNVFSVSLRRHRWLKSNVPLQNKKQFSGSAPGDVSLYRSGIFTVRRYDERGICYANSVCQSVRLSVTRVHCIKTTKRITEILSLSDRPIILDFHHQSCYVNLTASPLTGAQSTIHTVRLLF